MMAAMAPCLTVFRVSPADFIYTRANSAQPTSGPISAVNNQVRIPLSEVQAANLHLSPINIDGQPLRFMIIKKPTGYGTALDPCRICGAEGYRQDGQNVVCRHCGSAIYVPSIGEAGGCNPIGVPAHIEGGELVMDVSALTQAATEVPK